MSVGATVMRYVFLVVPLLAFYLIFFCAAAQEAPVHNNLRWAGLWLAAHKYFDVDRRKGDAFSWKHDERVFYRHFPTPRLRSLHPAVRAACDRGELSCIEEISQKAMISHSLSGIRKYTLPPGATDAYPFSTGLELFQYRTTASYFMCWFTMKRVAMLRNYMGDAKCLENLDLVKEKEWAFINVADYRKDTPESPFRCAELHFCPNFCYGKRTGGSVPSITKKNIDPGNPCRNQRIKHCKVMPNDNSDFDGLVRNLFNESCHCDTPGFEWNSRFKLCVDIDECVKWKQKCDHGKVCHNLKSTYKCVCRRGHTFDVTKNKCVELVPLPAHSFTRNGKVKAIRQKSALTKMLEYILGVRNSTDP